MSTYPLLALRSLRVRREDEAQRKLTAARNNEAQKKEAVQKAKKALDNYLLWIKNESERLFGSVLGQPNPIHKITEITQQISWNRTQQASFVIALEEAQKKLEEAKSETAICLKIHEEAYKNVWKINEHHKIWMHEEMQREEQEEAAELEEVAATIFTMNELKAQ